jgi:hypothetical protein
VRVARSLRAEGPALEFEEPFTFEELTAAMNKVKDGKAPGPDGMKPEYVRRLPDCARRELLLIYNHSWMGSWLPQDWRRGSIVPILKKGKDPASVGSYRPITLTSHLGKLMERLVTNRLSWWLESAGVLSPFQAGFRKGRSTADQCLRMSQHISDGFQRKPAQRTLLTLFDYSKAYDTVWRTGLLTKMESLGVPRSFRAWVKAWLQHRTARVRVDEVEGRDRGCRKVLSSPRFC